MNHHHLLSSLVAVALLSGIQTMAQTQIGYTTGNMGRTTVFHYGNNPKQGMAIRLSHEKLQTLAGRSITAVYTSFGSANAVKDKLATIFVATSMTDAPVCEQQCTIGSANRWTTVTLDTPYVITGQEEELLVGYTLTSSNTTIPEALQADMTNELRGCNYAWDGSAWVDLYGSGKGSPNLRLVLDQEVSFTDAMLSEVDFSQAYYVAGNEYSHSSHVYNFGTKPINRIDVTVQIDGETQTVTYDGLDIPQFETYEFALPALTTKAEGAVDVQVSVDVNGQHDECQEDNAFGSSAFFYSEVMERSFFVEEFTGMTCPNCPNGARTLHSAIERSEMPVVEITHHSGYAADFYSSDADWDYTMYYGSASTYAPAAMINRVHNPEASTVPVMNTGLQLLLSSFEYAAKHQPYVSLSLSSEFDAESREVKVNMLTYVHNKQLPGATLLNVYLVQDSVVGYQSNGGSDYVHNGLLRKVLTGNSWGLLLPDDLTKEPLQSWETTFTLPESIVSDFWTEATLAQANYNWNNVTIPTDPAHMRIVAYVASYDPENINNNMVYNCIEVPLVNGSYVQRGMPAINALQEVVAPSQSAQDGVYDLSGRRFDARAALGKGLYIVNGKKMLICE